MDQTAPAPTAAPLTIDIVSDVVCPWCYIGKRRLESALAQRPNDDVLVRWHPFQLDPTIPRGGLDRKSYMLKKFGAGGRIEEIHARLTAAGREDGIPFDFEAITRAVNTLDAHRLMSWAGEADLQDAAAEALFRAYFVEARDIGDPAVLADIAGGIGLDQARIATDLASDLGKGEIEAEIAEAARLGVSGVPFFIFARSFAVSGAQAADVLGQAIDRARSAVPASA